MATRQPKPPPVATDTAAPAAPKRKPAAKKATTAADPDVPKKPRAAPKRSAAAAPRSRDELIREAAYRRFVARGHVHGNDAQDWLDAEAEVDAALKRG